LLFPIILYHSLLVKGTFGFYHKWVPFSVPFAASVAPSGPDGPNGCRVGAGPIFPLLVNLSAMPKKEEARLMYKHQSDLFVISKKEATSMRQ
jgi:hypothetical protein